ncbi:hypothetical protein [Pseudonocardia lacus]|uniref:hypothetical protein n=1 Tax=Pseudonocardia lacus TaxID=2835865 RepID=UPI001BDBD860|nr:hypothetical protein [Pseudonocardia lacus]
MAAERRRTGPGRDELHEATARARKAARLSAVLTRAIDATPGFPVTGPNIHLLCTDPATAQFRRAFERLAGVRPSSELTWAVVEGLLDAHYSTAPDNVVHLSDRR